MNFKLRTIPCKIIAGWTPDKGGYKQLKLFGKVVFQYSKFDGCSKIEFFPHRQRKIRSVIHEYDSTMFFKVNRVSEYSILCIRTWMDIAEAMNSLVVIICDNPKLEKKSLKTSGLKILIFRLSQASAANSVRLLIILLVVTGGMQHMPISPRCTMRGCLG